MIGNARTASGSVRVLFMFVALIAIMPVHGFAAHSKGSTRRSSKADPCGEQPAAMGEPGPRTACVEQLVLAACRNGGRARVSSTVAARLRISESAVQSAFRKVSAGEGGPKSWCDLTRADIDRIIAYARKPLVGRAESREEWMRFTVGDENGYIPPDGLARALEQRQALIRSHDSARLSGIQSNLAALPTSPSGWTNVTGYEHPVGSINALLIHPTTTTTMWAGTDGGGIWKTVDGGTSWQPMNDFLASLSISSFAMRPGDPMTIYAATGAQGSHTGAGGAGVLKSIDGGNTWNPLPATNPATYPDFDYVYQIAISPTDSNTVMAATDGGAYITANGGSTWNPVATGVIARNVAIHPANANLRVIALDNGTVKVTTNGTTYYTYTIAAVSGQTFTRIALAPSNQSIMYALINNSGTTQLYRSTTTGASWSLVTGPASNLYIFTTYNYLSYTGALWVDPTNPNHVAAGEYWASVLPDASLASPDWSTNRLSGGWCDFHGIVSDPQYNGSTNKKVYFFDDGGLYRWTDVDTVHTVYPSYLAPNGVSNSEVYSVAGRGGNYIFGAQDVGTRIYMTATGDATQKWRFTYFPSYTWHRLVGDGGVAAVDRTNPNNMYGSFQRLTLQRSIDGGVNSDIICQGITDITCNPNIQNGLESGNAEFIAPFVLDPNNQGRMLAGAASLWRSNDVSTGTPPSWSIIHTSGYGGHVTAIAIAPTNSDVIWVAYTTGAVYKTTNGTAASPTFNQVTNVPGGNKLRIYIDRTDSSRVYIGLSGFAANRLVMTPDGGSTWSNVPGLPSASVYAIQQHPSIASWLYVGTGVGLFASEDGGSTWSTSNEGPANVQVRDLNWYSESGSSAVLLVGTFGRGVWRATIDGSGVTMPAPTNLVATPPTWLVCRPAANAKATSGSTAPGKAGSYIDWGPCYASVALTWDAVPGATYKIYRSSSLFSFSQIGTSPTNSYTDGLASIGVAYLYAVKATNGASDSPYSNYDLATTYLFMDSTLTSGMTIMASHVTQLREAINLVRGLAGLASATVTDATLDSTVTVKAAHIDELRYALAEARSTLMLPPLGYVDSPLISRSTVIKAIHVTSLRDGVK